MKNQKGITLIALIITIIVLLILAGISINLVVGENGILSKAGDAKKYTESESTLEKVQLAAYSACIEGNGEVRRDLLEKELKKNEFEVTSKNLTGIGPYYFTNKDNSVFEITIKGDAMYSDKKITCKFANFEEECFNDLPILNTNEEITFENVQIDDSKLNISVDLRRWSSNIFIKYK